MPEQTPEPHVHEGRHGAHEAAPDSTGRRSGRSELSIWFFCGILTLGYGVVLLVQSALEQFGLFGQHQPATVLAALHPTFWWGLLLGIFGGFYTVRFRPGKG